MGSPATTRTVAEDGFPRPFEHLGPIAGTDHRRRAAIGASATVALLLVLARAAAATFACVDGPEVQWTPEAGGNGHFYQAVCAPTMWDGANEAAVASGRHLATITSTEENAFVFALVDDQSFWTISAANCNLGPWLGGFQPAGSAEPAAAWSWVTGEAFDFDAWAPTEPNNVSGEEDVLHYFEDCTDPAVPSSTWNDIADTTVLPGYVAEWAHSLDVDGDGELQALTDGLLIVRRLFGLTGTALTGGAVDLSDCTRCDAATIEPFLATLVASRVYDVAQDWSDASNPNGPWSYLEGTDALPHVASWLPGSFSMAQPAWATAASGAGHIPAFFKAVEAVDDYQAGDVVIHSRDDSNGAGLGDARLRFTAPASGIYRIDLDVWITRDIGRTVAWALFVEDVQQASGTVASGDGFSRASPDGAAVSATLAAGDQVELRLTTQSSSGDLVGTRLRLEAFGLDIDGDGETQALSDGLLALRRLFTLTGSALTSGAVDLGDCTRCDAPAVEGFLDSFD